MDVENVDEFECIIDVMEEDGIIVHYYSDSEDATTIVDESEEGAVLTIEYYPWSKICSIMYRENENYG